MREVTPTLALRAREAVDAENKVGVQIGEPVGHARPPRVYLFFDEYPNGGVTSAVVHMMGSAGTTEAYEFPDPSTYEDEEGSKAKVAEMIQPYLESFSEDDDVSTLFFAGSEEIADNLIERLDIPGHMEASKNEEQKEYIP